MPFFEIDLFDPSNDEVFKIALEAKSDIEAYEIALIKATATVYKVPPPEAFKEIDFKRALVVSRTKSCADSGTTKTAGSNADKRKIPFR